MNNAINEIKNTLDRTNRITEAEDRIQFSSVTLSCPTLWRSALYGPTLTSIHDYWENHSFN